MRDYIVGAVLVEVPAASGTGALRDEPRWVSAFGHVLTASDEPTIVVAHSYGGIVIAEAATGIASVRHLLLVSSYLPEVGESLSSFGSDGPAPFLNMDSVTGTFTVRRDALADTFLADCDPEIQQAAGDRTAWQSLAVLAQPVTSSAWQHVASTYVVCTQDNGKPRKSTTRICSPRKPHDRARLSSPPVSLPASIYVRSRAPALTQTMSA